MCGFRVRRELRLVTPATLGRPDVTFRDTIPRRRNEHVADLFVLRGTSPLGDRCDLYLPQRRVTCLRASVLRSSLPWAGVRWTRKIHFPPPNTPYQNRHSRNDEQPSDEHRPKTRGAGRTRRRTMFCLRSIGMTSAFGQSFRIPFTYSATKLVTQYYKTQPLRTQLPGTRRRLTNASCIGGVISTRLVGGDASGTNGTNSGRKFAGRKAQVRDNPAPSTRNRETRSRMQSSTEEKNLRPCHLSDCQHRQRKN